MARSTKGIYFNQRKYALELISDTGLAGAKPFDTPMEQNGKLTSHELNCIMSPNQLSVSEDCLFPYPHEYQRLVGRLIYLTITRLTFVLPSNLSVSLCMLPRHRIWMRHFELLSTLRRIQARAFCSSLLLLYLLQLIVIPIGLLAL